MRDGEPGSALSPDADADVTSRPLLIDLDDPAAGDPSLTGGKAAALAQAGRQGLPRLPGVVLTTAFSAAVDAGADDRGPSRRARGL